MGNNQFSHIRKLLFIGLIASVITVMGGELPIGWTVYPESNSYILSMILGCGKLSMLQLFCGMLFGGIFIPLHYYGFEAVSQIVALGGDLKSSRLIHWGGLACAFWGGIVHVICVALMFICKMLDTQTLTVLPQSAIDFALYLVMPVSVVFMPVYYAMTVAMMVSIAKGKTILPKWAAVFNPLPISLLLNLLPEIVNAPWANALGMANMGLGSVVTFSGILLLLRAVPSVDKVS